MRNGPTVLFRVSMVAFGVVWLTGLGGVQAPLLAADEVEPPSPSRTTNSSRLS